MCVCLSSCPCLGSPGPCWCGVCRARCLVSSSLVGAVPKTGNDILGIPLPRVRLRARSHLDYMAIAHGASLLSTSTVHHLPLRVLDSSVSVHRVSDITGLLRGRFISKAALCHRQPTSRAIATRCRSLGWPHAPHSRHCWCGRQHEVVAPEFEGRPPRTWFHLCPQEAIRAHCVTNSHSGATVLYGVFFFL